MSWGAPARAELRGERFAVLTGRVVSWLPFGLSRIVSPRLVGFVAINGFTFGVDIALLSGLHALGLVLPLAITVAYVCAFGLSYWLNRVFNFRSHDAVGPQVFVYVLVVLVNYLVWILGVGAGLSYLGVDFRLSRVVAGGCEAVYMYCAMRFLVFRRA